MTSPNVGKHSLGFGMTENVPATDGVKPIRFHDLPIHRLCMGASASLMQGWTFGFECRVAGNPNEYPSAHVARGIDLGRLLGGDHCGVMGLDCERCGFAICWILAFR